MQRSRQATELPRREIVRVVLSLLLPLPLSLPLPLPLLPLPFPPPVWRRKSHTRECPAGGKLWASGKTHARCGFFLISRAARAAAVWCCFSSMRKGLQWPGGNGGIFRHIFFREARKGPTETVRARKKPAAGRLCCFSAVGGQLQWTKTSVAFSRAGRKTPVWRSFFRAREGVAGGNAARRTRVFQLVLKYRGGAIVIVSRFVPWPFANLSFAFMFRFIVGSLLQKGFALTV